MTESSNCQRYDELQESVDNSSEWTDLFNVKMGQKLETNLYTYLRAETGYTDYDLTQMSDVATYVMWANYHGIDLSFPLSEDDLKWS